MVAEAVIGSGNGEDEEGEEEPKYVEVGYISSAHGLRGEVRVMPSTDFPELRFAKVLVMEEGKFWFFFWGHKILGLFVGFGSI